jgi:exodeoxyribonuclease-3
MSTLFRVASFNVNGIRARLPVLLSWLKKEAPEVVCFQETKVQDTEFPRESLEGLGFMCAFRGEKGFNGVSVLSREPMELLRVGLDDEGPLDEARLILIRVLGIPLLNTYIPQGTAPDSDRFQYKLEWFQRLRGFLARHFKPEEPLIWVGEWFQRLRGFLARHFKPEEPLIWVGDFNVAPEARDVYDPEGLRGAIGFHPEEHRALEEVRQWGFADVFRLHVAEGGHYTFWDYRVPNALARKMGWRVDHIWATDAMAQRSQRAWVDLEPRRSERPSDHTPILAEFEVD